MPEVVDLLAEFKSDRQAVDQLSAELSRLKTEGNAHFQKDEFADAIAAYQRAIDAARSGWRHQIKGVVEAKAIINPLRKKAGYSRR